MKDLGIACKRLRKSWQMEGMSVGIWLLKHSPVVVGNLSSVRLHPLLCLLCFSTRERENSVGFWRPISSLRTVVASNLRGPVCMRAA